MHTSQFSAAILSFLLSITISPLLIYFAGKSKSNHEGTIFRQVHGSHIPRFGGIAIFLSFFISISLLLLLGTDLVNRHFLKDDFIFWLLGISLLIFAIGLFDDLFHLRARYKLLLEIIVALISAIYLLQIQILNIPFVGVVDLGLLSVPFTVLWIVGIINALNLIDGLDGLAAGISIIALLGVVLVAFQSQQYMYSTIGIVTISSILGFLIYNHYPAKLFMGDSGSFFLGFLLAILSMLGSKQNNQHFSLVAPIAILGVPITDTLFSIIRRSIRGIPFFSADKNHIHHKLLSKGYSHIQTVYFLYFASIVFLLVYFLTIKEKIDSRLAIVLFFGISYLLIFYSGYREMSKPIDFIRSRKTSKKERMFSMELSKNIEVFYKNAKNIEDIFFVFSTWAEQITAVSSEISFGETKLSKYPENFSDLDKVSLKQLSFNEGDINIYLRFASSFFDLDSDVKFKNLNDVIEKTFHYLKDKRPDHF